MPVTTVEWDLDALMKWARSIAIGVCRDFAKLDCRFAPKSQYEEDLASTAYFEARRQRERFDESRVPANWRGTVQAYFEVINRTSIRTEVRREAERLRNGGLYRTKEGPPIVAYSLPVINDDGREEIALAAPVIPYLVDDEEPVDVPASACTGPGGDGYGRRLARALAPSAHDT